jgi:hypothetical protein
LPVAKPPPAWEENKTAATEKAAANVTFICLLMVGFLQNVMCGRENKKRLSCHKAEETKLVFRGTTLLIPVHRGSLYRIQSYPCSVTGAPVCAYSGGSAQRLGGQFNDSAPLCLAPTDTSLKGLLRLLLRVLAFDGHTIAPSLCTVNRQNPQIIMHRFRFAQGGNGRNLKKIPKKREFGKSLAI